MRKKITIALLLILSALQNLSANETQTYPYNFVHESFDNPSLLKLRELYDFDEYILSGKTEYEQMTLLKDWVYTKLQYGFKSPVPELRDSLEILRLAGEETTFLCSSYAALYLQCALSMGWTARYIFLQRPTGKQHASVDIWSNRYRKWIYMDPTWNIHVEEKGVPLSIIEIRRRWLSKKYRSMNFVFSSGKKAVRFNKSKFPFRKGSSELWRNMPIDAKWLSYTWGIGVVGRNDLFSDSNIWSKIYIIKDKYNAKSKKWALRKRESLPVSILFSMCNIPSYTIRTIKEDPQNREIKLIHNTKKSFTPSFDHFEIEINNEWVTTESKFIAGKKKIASGIKIRTVNTMGVAGPTVIIKSK
ncbi:MAG: transglutaminase-like domain-containing protein [Spirochaetia bacterium]|nr:transglutaminase-like domain-containing protein [Spirochaetia bacterium]